MTKPDLAQIAFERYYSTGTEGRFLWSNARERTRSVWKSVTDAIIEAHEVDRISAAKVLVMQKMVADGFAAVAPPTPTIDDLIAAVRSATVEVEAAKETYDVYDHAIENAEADIERHIERRRTAGEALLVANTARDEAEFRLEQAIDKATAIRETVPFRAHPTV